ncbi:MAG: lipid A export permease/ATP-binding protein MsbA [Burkholderiales bacterium]
MSVNTTVLQRIRRLAPYFGNTRGTWVLVAIAAMVGAASEPLIPALLKPLLDQGFQRGELEIWTVPVALLALFGVRGTAGYVAQIGLSKITNTALVILRRAMFNKILTADLQLFANQSSSALSNTLVYEVQNGAVMLVNAMLNLSRNGLTLLALVGYLFYLNWKLTLIVAAVFPSVAWVMRWLTARVHQITKASQSATDNLAYVVEENVLAHRDIRLYSAQKSQSERFDQLGESLRHLAMKSTVAGSAMTPVTQMLAAVALSAVISVALAQSSSSGTSVGGFVAFVTAMLMIVAPIRQLSEVSGPITRGLAALERALELIDNAPVEMGGSYSKERATGHIRFENVRVQYPSAQGPTIDALDLEVNPGETVALVGASGSGKTTLANLLPRFVPTSAGRILLDEHDIREWDINALRSQFAVVSQQVVMLNDTVAANVALGMALERHKVVDCLQAANLSSFIAELPQGIDTPIGHNGSQLSGGQRQRLAIARALYKDAPILILDEATSALDTESERSVQDALLVLMKNRTTLVIAHRLSTIMHADRIVVMEAGHIVESGSHAALLEQNGIYARLYRLGQDGPAHIG